MRLFPIQINARGHLVHSGSLSVGSGDMDPLAMRCTNATGKLASSVLPAVHDNVVAVVMKRERERGGGGERASMYADCEAT